MVKVAEKAGFLAEGSKGWRVVKTEVLTDDAEKKAKQQLSRADQKKVEAFLNKGVNAVQRKPFRPLALVLVLTIVVVGLSLMSQAIATWAGIN